jgi:hypothetical protein
LIRRRHANGESAHLAARHCLQAAGIRGQDVNRVAIPSHPLIYSIRRAGTTRIATGTRPTARSIAY